ncbi:MULTISPECIES: gamma-glutamylcyclotransferase [unclassified Paracoccus (in: a-proteobacteria)]|uniref:gamma-glutamylcyclotransferase n=1 Tax=unclassified Paracoccus (in: a-proteobacteria) TaxID=2688777 RepID=UPI0012B3C8CB|nr:MULTISPECIES: gamma-glutamylcyclotransferase [unclassified Paracoccus (in: a-proteobacteria)]UXU74319.1 gamma-glutamylcyclotransferase [Paracoccus sp. SMMA_5]UXU80209.1 gamma-glutamylcyclotransferase [Paracoccus sp. SMMA_5_TC]
MTKTARKLSLTSDHVARIHRHVPDTGPTPGVAQQTDADYAWWVEKMLASHPAPDRPTQLFAYGSLIWKPEIEHRAEQVGVARGWHRAFCLRQQRFRGTPDCPGLMMALDRGGQCRGVLYELPRDDLGSQLDRLFRREFTIKPINSMPRWIQVQTEAGLVGALAFVMNRASPHYAGRLPAEEVARTLARACGHWGSGAEYLLNTVTHLEERGIHDRGLWRLQQLVAQQIDAQPG